MWDKNLPRWVKISVAKHFKTAAAAISLPMQAIGIDDSDSGLFGVSNRAELRLNGPSIREHDKGVFKCKVAVNILITETIGEEAQNVYSGTDFGGEMLIAASGLIEIRRYGSGPVNDGSLVGCLALESDTPAELYDFGQLTDQDRVHQLMVDARYYLETTSRGVI
jgi:hypothetical protein